MELNANFDERAVVHAAKIDWVASPMKGVDRRMLDRIGDEVARATTIVRFAPGSHFSPHVHTGGEEFLVLDGVFSDEHGDFPAGSYIRNPPESSHTPGSEPGCTILVKLWQFDMKDRTHIRIDTNKMLAMKDAARPGVAVQPLFKDEHEDVRMEIWDADSDIVVNDHAGLELFVIEGQFEEKGEAFEPSSWLRLPKGDTLRAKTGAGPVKVWIKRDHLKETPTAPVV